MTHPNYTENQYYSNPEEKKVSQDKILPKTIAIGVGVVKSFFDSVQTLVIALALFVVVYLYILSPHQVAGSSMAPTFQDGEILLADKLTPRFTGYKRGDVIIFKYDATKDYIKRIVGLPGEKIKISDGQVYINGNKLEEPYLKSGVKTVAKNLQFLKEDEEKIVPQNSYFVLGDNREGSTDSRVIGFIDKDEREIKGRVWVVYWPFDKIRIQQNNSTNN